MRRGVNHQATRRTSTASAWTTRRARRGCATSRPRNALGGFHGRLLRGQRLPRARGRPARRAAGDRSRRSRARRRVRRGRRFRTVPRDTCVVVTSDHGHCEVLADAERAVIRLDQVLADFRQADLGRAWRSGDDIMICPNMRAAQIYVRIHAGARSSGRATSRDSDRGRSGDVAPAQPEAAPTATPSRARGDGSSSPGAAGEARSTRSAAWTVVRRRRRPRRAVDGEAIAFGHYPNAFERIAGVLDLDQSGEIWVTARPGCVSSRVPGGSRRGRRVSWRAARARLAQPVMIAGAGPLTPAPAHARQSTSRRCACRCSACRCA